MINIIKSNSVYMLNAEAKDIYLSNNLVSDRNKKKIIGYNTKNKNKKINLKKYINAFDYSLDLIKLEEIFQRKYNKLLYFTNDKGKKFTDKIINVNFKYSHKEYNKFGKSIYIKDGYIYNQCEINDCCYIVDNELIAIELNKNIENKISDKLLGKYFEFNQVLNQYQLTKKTIKTLHSVGDLRDILYENGFFCNGIHFVRFKRSSGSSRVGKCIFIDSRLYNEFHKWESCGLNIKTGDPIDLAAFESYISLTSSSIIDTIKINKENILIVDDYNSIFYDDVISTKIINGQLVTQEEKAMIKNSIWDGESLLDVSLFGKYSMYGCLLLRNKMFKSCCFNTNIQKFFKDNNITELNQLNYIFTEAKDIKDIKLITTPNSIKYQKFNDISKWIDIFEPNFGIVKHDKKTHHFNGKMVSCNYQLLNTLQFSYQEMQEFLKPTLNYLELLRTDPDVLRFHIKCPKSDFDLYEKEEITKNDIIFKLMKINDNFCNTKLYDSFKKDLIKSFLNNSKQGHILINGNYPILFGNPMELLNSTIGKFDGTSEIGIGEVVSSFFKCGEELIASRSPHICAGNVWLPKNIKNENINKYFNLTDEIVCVNSIGDNLLERLNGCDFDVDSVILSNEKLLVDIAKRNLGKFKIPTNLVEAKSIQRYYTWQEQSDLDKKVSVNKIGEIVNLSQELNTYLWHDLNNGKTFEDVKDIYLDICKLAVMSCIEIDRAKKEFDVNMAQEIIKIKDKHRRFDKNEKLLKPKFFKMITLNNGFKLNEKFNYVEFMTSMDFLQNILGKFKNKKTVVEFTKLVDIIDLNNYNVHNVWKVQCDKIISETRKLNYELEMLWKYTKEPNDKKYIISKELKNKLFNKIKEIKISNNSMIYLLKCTDDEKYKDCSKILFDVLSCCKTELFFECFIKNVNNIKNLVESTQKEICFYGRTFIKTL